MFRFRPFRNKKKIDKMFLSEQFVNTYFEIRARKEIQTVMRCLFRTIRKCLIWKRLTHLQPINLECACSELTISKKKWICFSICRPPTSQNIHYCF